MSRLSRMILLVAAPLWSSVLFAQTEATVPADSLLFREGKAFFERGQYDSAFVHYEQALELVRHAPQPDPYFITTILHDLAWCCGYTRRSDQEQYYLQWALAVYSQAEEMNPQVFCALHHDLALNLADRGLYAEAELHFDTALTFLTETDSVTLGLRSGVLRSVGWMHGIRGRYETAIPYLKEGLALKIALTGPEGPGIPTMYHIIGYNYLYSGSPDTALSYLRKGLEGRLRVHGEHHPATGQSYTKMAECFTHLGKYRQSLSFSQLAIQSMIWEQGPGYKTVYPLDKILSRKVILDALKQKIQALNYLYGKADGDTNDLKLALTHFDQLWDLLYETQQLAEGRGNQARWLGRYVNSSERALLCASDLYKATGDPKWLGQAFQYAEKSRSYLLQMALQQQEALEFGIPEALQKREQQFRIRLATAEDGLRNAMAETDVAKRTEQLADYHDLQREHAAFVDSLEAVFPAYHELKYEPSEIELNAVQRWLPDTNSLLLEFYHGYYYTYGFGITRDSVWLVTLGTADSLNRATQQLVYRLSTPPQHSTPAAHDSLIDELAAHYDALILPLVQRMPNQLRNLVIVPDGAVSYLPFGTLITDRNEGDFRKQRYLMQSCQIRYAYAASLLLEYQHDAGNALLEPFAGFAPTYGSDSLTAELDPLFGAHEEVFSLAELTQGRAITGEAATKARFLELVDSVRIVHIAAHTNLDDREPLQSAFAFSGADGAPYLRAAELFNLKVRAELAVLSGCETGAGPFAGGEGVMSLSRAFAYAGCPSVVMSLWKTEDNSNHQLMVAFYAGLEAGLTKSEALRQARLQFLESADPLTCHPFFWASFVAVGDDRPLVSEPGPDWPVIGFIGTGVAGLLLLLGGMFLRRRKSA